MPQIRKEDVAHIVEEIQLIKEKTDQVKRIKIELDKRRDVLIKKLQKNPSDRESVAELILIYKRLDHVTQLVLKGIQNVKSVETELDAILTDTNIKKNLGNKIVNLKKFATRDQDREKTDKIQAIAIIEYAMKTVKAFNKEAESEVERITSSLSVQRIMIELYSKQPERMDCLEHLFYEYEHEKKSISNFLGMKINGKVVRIMKLMNLAEFAVLGAWSQVPVFVAGPAMGAYFDGWMGASLGIFLGVAFEIMKYASVLGYATGKEKVLDWNEKRKLEQTSNQRPVQENIVRTPQPIKEKNRNPNFALRFA